MKKAIRRVHSVIGVKPDEKLEQIVLSNDGEKASKYFKASVNEGKFKHLIWYTEGRLHRSTSLSVVVESEKESKEIKISK